MKTGTQYEPHYIESFGNPDSYAGPDLSDYFVVYGKNRDSHLIENVNYDCIKADLQKAFDALPESERVIGAIPKYGNSPGGPFFMAPESELDFLDIRQGHWAVGWIELLLIHKDSKLLEFADSIGKKLDGYPIYDEDAVSDAETEEIWKFIEDCDFERLFFDKFTETAITTIDFDKFRDLLWEYERKCETGALDFYSCVADSLEYWADPEKYIEENLETFKEFYKEQEEEI